MSGRGKGQGVAPPGDHRKVLRDSVQGITSPAIRRRVIQCQIWSTTRRILCSKCFE
ncbi:Histone-fold [Phytophthora cactorum]|nr:Histone-fold [Phytophthora cactorum]